jgi:hypothetical protein
MDSWSILRPFGMFYAYLLYFMIIWYITIHIGIGIVSRKIWQPLCQQGNYFRTSFSLNAHLGRHFIYVYIM